MRDESGACTGFLSVQLPLLEDDLSIFSARSIVSWVWILCSAPVCILKLLDRSRRISADWSEGV